METTLAILLVIMSILDILLVIVYRRNCTKLKEEYDKTIESYQNRLQEKQSFGCVCVSTQDSGKTETEGVPKNIRKRLASRLGYALIDETYISKDDSNDKTVFYATLRFKSNKCK